MLEQIYFEQIAKELSKVCRRRGGADAKKMLISRFQIELRYFFEKNNK